MPWTHRHDTTTSQIILTPVCLLLQVALLLSALYQAKQELLCFQHPSARRLLFVALHLCMLGNFEFFFVVCGFSLKLTFFFKKIFQEYQQRVKEFGPRSGQHFVGSNLGPNCLQRLSAETKVTTSRERVNLNGQNDL